MKIPVVWTSVLFERIGFAEEARETILALDRAGIPVLANPVAWTPWQRSPGCAEERRLEELIALRLPDRFIHVMHTTPTDFARHPRAARHIGRCMSELETYPAAWAAACSELDEIWVPGGFSTQALVRAGVPREAIHVVPEGVRIELYDPPPPALSPAGFDGFVFLSVLGWGLRKGWDVLVRAYLEEFRPDEDVTLVLKIAPFDRRLLARLEAFMGDELGLAPEDRARVVALDVELTSDEMPGLYRAADAFVLASRGEGWGRPYMEAMAAGLPTIGSRWGGNLAFMDDANAYLIDCEVVDVPEAAWREVPPYRGGRWAEPSVEHLRALMRRVFAERGEAAERARRGRETILASFTARHVAHAVAGRLEQIDFGPAVGTVPRPQAAAGYVAAASSFLEGAQPGRAARFARAALELDPSSRQARETLAEALDVLGLARAAERARAGDAVPTC
ncbi:MAG: glycosyltransferase family 4 protein [Gaiellaceae bacterium]